MLPLLRHVRVLATGHQTAPSLVDTSAEGGEAPHFGTITLALTPTEVARLALAEQVGTIRVALIPQHHPTAGPMPTLLKGALFGIPPTNNAASPPMIQYIIGSPGRNQVSELPVATPLPHSAPASTPQRALLAREQQELQTLTHLVHAASPTAAIPPTPSAMLPKGYP